MKHALQQETDYTGIGTGYDKILEYIITHDFGKDGHSILATFSH